MDENVMKQLGTAMTERSSIEEELAERSRRREQLLSDAIEEEQRINVLSKQLESNSQLIATLTMRLHASVTSPQMPSTGTTEPAPQPPVEAPAPVDPEPATDLSPYLVPLGDGTKERVVHTTIKQTGKILIDVLIKKLPASYNEGTVRSACSSLHSRGYLGREDTAKGFVYWVKSDVGLPKTMVQVKERNRQLILNALTKEPKKTSVLKEETNLSLTTVNVGLGLLERQGLAKRAGSCAWVRV